jgi:hypothetical protein
LVQLNFEVILVGDGCVIEPNLSVKERGDAGVAADAMRTGHRVCPGRIEGDTDSPFDAGTQINSAFGGRSPDVAFLFLALTGNLALAPVAPG